MRGADALWGAEHSRRRVPWPPASLHGSVEGEFGEEGLMVIGATVTAALLLLIFVAERGSGWLWQGGRDGALFYCESCDLRYPRRALTGPDELCCPRGHIITAGRDAPPLGTVLIAACAAFVGIALLLIATGVVS